MPPPSESKPLSLREERALLARARGRKRLDLILDARDPRALVRDLPAEELYFVIQEVGFADARVLVPLATAEQFRTFLDLDAWAGDELRPDRTLAWLDAARSGSEGGYRRKLETIDLEVLELTLRAHVQIYDLEEEEEPAEDPEGAVVEKSPDGRYLLFYVRGDEHYPAARALIAELYAKDAFAASRFLSAIRHELTSALTEDAYRWRNARLADLGFPSPEEAASLYAKVDLKAELPPAPALPEMPPGFFLAALEHGSLLDRALGLTRDETRDALQLQLATVLNQALVADRIDVSDVDAVRETARAVRETIALGLAQVAGDDPVRAAEQLADKAMKRIFQVGFTLTLQLRWEAEKLVRERPVRLEGASGFLPEAEGGEALAALLLPRPRYAAALDGPGTPPAVRPFATLAEVERAKASLARTRLLAELFEKAGLSERGAAEAVVESQGPAGLALVRYGELFLTAAARELVGEGFAFAALPTRSLEAFVHRAFSPKTFALTAVFRERSTDALVRCAAQLTPAHEEAARRFARESLDRLELELAPQLAAEGALDPDHALPLLVVR